MKVGSLVKIPNWQLKRERWVGWRKRGIGVVLDVTPYAIHVRWSNGEELAHRTHPEKGGVVNHFEVLA